MLRWFSPPSTKTHQTSSVRRRQITLQLEALEVRDCPSASPLDPPLEPGEGFLSDSAFAALDHSALSLTLSVEAGSGGTATVSGQVTSASATGGLTVTFFGVVSGSVTTSADGTFIYTGTPSGQGPMKAFVTDGAGNVAIAYANLGTGAPTIVNFQAVNNGNNTWTFTGLIQHPHAGGKVVTLAGIPSLDNNNASVTVQDDGYFSYTITLRPGESGCVTAVCTDSWGQTSNAATAYVWS